MEGDSQSQYSALHWTIVGTVELQVFSNKKLAESNFPIKAREPNSKEETNPRLTHLVLSPQMMTRRVMTGHR